MKKCSARIENLEFRTCDEYLIANDDENHTTGEIIKRWENSINWGVHCVAYWKRNNDGEYNLRFVGDRPFQQGIDPQDFMTLAKYGQKILDTSKE